MIAIRGYALPALLLCGALCTPASMGQAQDNEGVADPNAQTAAQPAAEDEAPSAGQALSMDPPSAGAPTTGNVLGFVAPPATPPVSSQPIAVHEQVCDDRLDNDGDGLRDCADADCYGHPSCHAGGHEERNNERCSDWIDNDGDGSVDCEDEDCQSSEITVCQGSWRGSPGGNAGGDSLDDPDDIPELTGDMSVEDLIGQGSDNDGERNDYLCSDGVDNDNDGRTDCADFGCRFDPSVTVCASTPGIRFGVVAGLAGSLRIDETPDIDGDGFTEFTEATGDVRFSRIQLRALGPIPFIHNSFFLLSFRAERTFRLTFANFSLPLGNAGHYISLNSGSGGLSSGLIISASKRPLLDAPFYLFNAFEQGNGAAVEVGGPITEDNRYRFRVFAAGGSGQSNGNVGGRFFRSEERNFSYSGGAQLHINLVGHHDRFDSPYLYTESPLTMALSVGGRFDQRPIERYAAANVQAVFRYSRFSVNAESYSRYVFDFDGFQTAWNVQAGVLLVPRTLFLAADVGGFFVPLDFDPAVVDAAGGYGSDLRQPMEVFQWRAALHWFYFRNIGILSVLYSMKMECQHVFGGEFCEPPPTQPEAAITEHEVRLEAQFRF